MKKQFSLIALFVLIALLFASCGESLPTDPTTLSTKMQNKGYGIYTERDERIFEYVEEYGAAEDDVTGIIHADKQSKNEGIQIYMGTFIFCKDKDTATKLITTIKADFAPEYENTHIDFTTKQKGSIIFFGTSAVWKDANN